MQQRVRGINSSYSELCCSEPQCYIGYGVGQLACLFKHRLGSGDNCDSKDENSQKNKTNKTLKDINELLFEGQ